MKFYSYIKKAIISIFFLMLFTPCMAQDLVFSPSAPIETSLDTTIETTFPSIRKEFYYYDEAWFPFLFTLSEKNKTDALRILGSLEDAKLNYGDKNVSFYSYSLLALSQEQEKDGDIETAANLIDESIRLSPDIARLYFYKARFVWRNDPGHLYDIVNLLVTGIKLSIRDITTITTFAGNVALSIIIAFLSIFTVFSLSLAAKYLLLAANDIKDRFGWEIPLFLFSAFIAVLFFFIFSLGIGLIWLIFLINIAFLIYYSKSEKTIFAFFYSVIIISPLIFNYTSAFMLSTHRDVIDEIIQVKEDTYTLKTEKSLIDWTVDNPDDISALFALGSLNKRTGYLDYAERYYKKVIEYDPSFAPALNNLGVIYFILHEYNRSEEYFLSAISADPDLVAPYYNLYKVSMTRFDLNTAEEYYDKAMKIDPARITAFLDIEVKEEEGEPSFLERTNRMVIDEDLPNSFLWKRIFLMSEPKELASNLYSAMMKGIGLRVAPIFGILGFIFLFISGSLAQKSLLSKFCKFCGLPFLLKSQPHMQHRDSCNRCFSVFVRKEGVDPKTKADLRMKVDRINHIRRIVLVLLNFIIPGFGRIYRDRAIRGFIFLSLFLFFFVQLITFRGIVAYPVKSFGLPVIHNPYLYGICSLIIYLIAQRDFIKSEMSET